jgi:hypothetical protein
MEQIQMKGSTTGLQGNRSYNAGFDEVINASSRIQRLRKRFFTHRPSICIERARIASYYSDPRNQSLPLILQRPVPFGPCSTGSPSGFTPMNSVGSLASPVRGPTPCSRKLRRPLQPGIGDDLQPLPGPF